jgi:hypothetical protein
MKNFQNQDRVEVYSGHLEGLQGTVIRLRRCDIGAWVRMDSKPENFKHVFPFPDSDERSNDIVMHPMECRLVERVES